MLSRSELEQVWNNKNLRNKAIKICAREIAVLGTYFAMGASLVAGYNYVSDLDSASMPVPVVSSEWVEDNRGSSEYFATFIKFDGELYRIDVALVEYALQKVKTNARDYLDFSVYDLSNENLLSRILKDIIRPTSDKEEDAQRIVDFVHSFAYLDDPIRHQDYVKSPLETIVDGGGDCEDFCTLGAGLLYLSGFDCVLVGLSPNPGAVDDDGKLLRGHMVVGIRGNFSGANIEHEGRIYTLIEMTGTTNPFYPRTKRIGDFDWDKYAQYTASVVPLKVSK